MRAAAGLHAFFHPCWGVIMPEEVQLRTGHSFLGSWHWGPEGFLPEVGMWWRNWSGLFVTGITYAKARGWEISRTVFGVREPSSVTPVCGVDTEGLAGEAGRWGSGLKAC